MPLSKEDRESPFPRAALARVLDPHEKKLSGMLVARQLGHLAVKVTFHRHPIYDVEVKFFEAAADGGKGAAVGDPLKTDRNGVARVDHMVDAGLYVCEIENQDPTIARTSSDPMKPHVVPTPVGRPYFDFDEAPEFDHEIREVYDYEGVGDGESNIEDDEKKGIMTVSFALKDADGLDDGFPKFILESKDGSYSRTITAKDAISEKKGWKQIVFRNLVPDVDYRLTQVHDEDFRRVIFDDAPYEAIITQEHDAGKLLEGHALHEFEVAAPGDVSWT